MNDARPSAESDVAPLALGPIALCYAYRALLSALVAAPVSFAFGDALAHHPRGDAVLFDAGGLWLLEAQRLALAEAASLARLGGLVLLLGMFGWLIPLGALIASFDAARPSLGAALGRGARRFGSLVLLQGAALLARVLILGAAVVAGGIAGGGDDASPLRQAIGMSLPLSALLVWWLTDLFHDAVRVVRIHEDDGLWASTKVGVRLMWARFGGACAAAGWRAAVGILALAGAAVAGRLLSGGGSDALTALVIVHQLAILVHVMVRASWFRWLTRELAGGPPTIKDRFSLAASTLRSPEDGPPAAGAPATPL